MLALQINWLMAIIVIASFLLLTMFVQTGCISNRLHSPDYITTESIHNAAIATDKPSAETDIVPRTDQIKTLECVYLDRDICIDRPCDIDAWCQANEVTIHRRCIDGGEEGPKTYVRFLWTKTHLIFHVEVERRLSDPHQDHNEELWHGNNIEFLIAPRWHATPLKDEYEFLFNSSGRNNTLHWTTGLSLQQSLAWTPSELKWAVKPLVFHTDMPGWAFEGKISFSAFDINMPNNEDYWGLGLYRKNLSADSTIELLAWSPTLTDPVLFHIPDKFGALVFSKTNRTPQRFQSKPISIQKDHINVRELQSPNAVH
ncbi:MAG: hypothetical protein L3J79_12675 [Candidatus Marinimicrobia bacterium]|nr:hypothetical protein [Candidatus Neomarinimicrobiota bacterium]